MVPAVIGAQTTPPPATITPTPATLTYQYQLGPTAKLPAGQNVTVKTSATSLVATLTIGGDLNGDWLEASVRRNTTIKLPGSFTVTVTPTSLSAGTYNATITLSAIDANQNPVTGTIAVRLVISAAPSQLDFSPPAGLTFNYTTGTTPPLSQEFLMYSEGAPMAVTVSVSGATWLKLNPSGSVQLGGLYMPITVSIDPTALAALVPKVYTANITISAPTALNKSTTYPITLNVNAEVPIVTDTWPSGVVLTNGTGSTAIVLDGTGFFDTSTVSVTGFTSSSTITVTDSTTPAALTASETFSIPVYLSTATFLRLTLGSPLPAGFVGTAYSQNLSTFALGGTGPGTYSWSQTGLDAAGLTLDATTGMLTGTPVAGNYQGIITVTDTNGAQAYMPVSLTIHAGFPPLTGEMWIRTTTPVSAGTVQTAGYSTTLVVDGGTTSYTWSLNNTTPLPAGLSLTGAGASATIAGTPTSVGMTGILTEKRLSDGALQVTVPNTYLTRLGFLRMTVLTPTPGGGGSNEAQFEVYGPEPRVLGVGNAASYASGAVAPGELISIFGTGLGPTTLSVYDPNDPAGLETALPIPPPAAGQTLVQFTDGSTIWNAPLVYTSATQVGAMVPFEVQNSTSVTMAVSYGPTGSALVSQPFPLTVSPQVPGIFTADASGRGQGAILNYIAATNDYTINSASTPAILKDGPIVVLYVTGFGITNPASSSYAPAQAGVDTNTPASVTIDGKSAAPVVSGVPQGSFPGLLQLNVTVPTNATAGKAVPVTVSIGAAAQAGVTMALK